MRRHSAGLTDVGRRRIVNEDHLFFDDLLGLYVVADGMGGHAAGDIASHEAVDAVRGMIGASRSVVVALEAEPNAANLRRAVRLVESAVQAAAYHVFGIAENEPDHQGMGTTVSTLTIIGQYGIIGQVGDSRVYLVRGGVTQLLTEDHTLVAWQIKQGIISEEQAKYSPHKNVITRAVGSRDYVQVDTNVVEIKSGDTFLVCSDGLHGYLEDQEIPSITALGPNRAVSRFVEMANERGGRDNITAIVVELH